jgi:hypothetical protein
MKILEQAVAVLAVLHQTKLDVSASSSIRGGLRREDTNGDRVQMLVDRYLKKDEEDDSDNKRDKNDVDSAAPSTFPSDEPSETPSESPTKKPTEWPSETPTEPSDPLVIEADDNVTSIVDDSVDLYAGNLTDVNATEVPTWWNDTDDFVMMEETPAPTLASSPENPTPSPTDKATETQVVIEVQEDNEDLMPEDLMPCYWRFLTGNHCTNIVNGDVIDAVHHQFVVSDGQCHYNDFLGYYRARCTAAQPENGNPARIYLQDVFCSDAQCSSCLQNGVVRPELYSSHMCNYLHFPATSRNSVEYDLAFEFVGGCFENESCSRVTIAGDGSSH